MTVSEAEANSHAQGRHHGSNESDINSDTDVEIFSLAAMDLRGDTEKLSALLNEFSDETTETNSRYPPMVLLLQHFEIFLSAINVKAAAIRVSNYFVKQRNNSDIKTFVDATASLYRDLRRMIGSKQFDIVSRTLRDGGTTMALGLAPSIYLRSTNCSKCSARRCLHLFCPECGLIFDIKADICKEMGIELIDIKMKKVDPRTKLLKKVQDSKPKCEFPLKREEDTKPNIKRRRTRRDIRSRCDQAGMAGIQELFKSVKDDRYLMTFGGDVLLLLRNVAVTAAGEPKDLAISCFQQVCARWLQAHGELGINIPEEHDSDDEETEDKKRESIIKDTTEGLYVISKMLLSDSRESRMLLRRGRDTPEEVCHKLFPDVCKKERSRDVKPSIVTSSASASATESGPPCHADQTNEEEEDYIEFAGVRKRGSAAISMQDKRTGDDSLDPRELIISAVQQSSSSSSTARSSSPAPFSPSDVKSSHSGCIAAHGTMDTPRRDLYDEDGNIISAAAAAVTSPQERNMKEDMKKRKRAVDETVTDSFADGSNSSSSSSSSSFRTDSSKSQTVDKVDPPCNSSKPMSPSASALASAPVPVPVEFTEAALLMKESLSHHLHMYQGALIDFIPSRGAGKKRGGRLPLLPVSKVVHCGDCGSMESNKGRNNCLKCKKQLEEHLDYSSVLDTLLWSYFFARMDVPDSHVYEGYCKEVMQLLPLIRSYQQRAELGSEFFKWQCYFATHVVYFFSDYGQQALNRQIFAEEFRLLATNLDYVCTDLKDVELAGEFVQCLKILQYTEEADPELEPMVTSALRFLLSRGRDKDKDKDVNGKSSTSAAADSSSDRPVKDNEYDRRYSSYHTSYCAAIGLVDYEFLQSEETRLNPPVPGIFKLCDTHMS